MLLMLNEQTDPCDWAEDSLLSQLRDHLGLTGAKYCCGQGLCGACTVEAEAAALARAAGALVKVQRTRAQECALAFHRPSSSHRIRTPRAQLRYHDL